MAEIAVAVVERAEQSSGMPSITLAQAATIQAAREAAGIVFGSFGAVTLGDQEQSTERWIGRRVRLADT